MPFHVLGYETSASEAALTNITPIPDGVAAIQGNDIFVPKDVPNIIFANAAINSAAATLRAQIVSPSLRAVVPVDVSPITNGLIQASPPLIVPYNVSPLPLVPFEPLDVAVQNGAAVMNRAFLTLSDKATTPTSGKIYTVRATAGITELTATWANGSLTFQTTLPAGNYNVVGMRVVAANAMYARLFFKGSFYRPGAPAIALEGNNEWPYFRAGNIGVWDSFNNVTPPSLDVMGVTDTAQIVYLDLIKTS